MKAPPVRMLLADVDGTLVTTEKALTSRTIASVRKLRDQGIQFAITSGRPPRGMSMLVEPLQLTTPIAGFNGGVFACPDMSIIEQKTVPEDLVEPILALLDSHALTTWLYRGPDWLVRDLGGPHVAREARTVQFDPALVESFAGLSGGVAKIVGVSEDHQAVEAAVRAARLRFGDHVSAACSQPYYVDVTHPDANKGAVLQYLSARYRIPATEIAAIGDMPNDVLMFAHSGLSIAMGNASSGVQRAARHVTASNDEEGFARAVEGFVIRTKQVGSR